MERTSPGSIGSDCSRCTRLLSVMKAELLRASQPLMELLINASSDGEADQIASTYRGFLFLVDLAALAGKAGS